MMVIVLLMMVMEAMAVVGMNNYCIDTFGDVNNGSNDGNFNKPGLNNCMYHNVGRFAQ